MRFHPLHTTFKCFKGESDKSARGKDLLENPAHIYGCDRGNLKQVVVKPGIADDNFTEILSDEVKEGMEVVTAETSSRPSTKTPQKAPWGRSTRY